MCINTGTVVLSVDTNYLVTGGFCRSRIKDLGHLQYTVFFEVSTLSQVLELTLYPLLELTLYPPLGPNGNPSYTCVPGVISRRPPRLLSLSLFYCTGVFVSL